VVLCSETSTSLDSNEDRADPPPRPQDWSERKQRVLAVANANLSADLDIIHSIASLQARF
jgi:hypothetical protein